MDGWTNILAEQVRLDEFEFRWLQIALSRCEKRHQFLWCSTISIETRLSYHFLIHLPHSASCVFPFFYFYRSTNGPLHKISFKWFSVRQKRFFGLIFLKYGEYGLYFYSFCCSFDWSKEVGNISWTRNKINESKLN